MDFKGKIKNLGPSKLSLRVMQNIHSPNRFLKTLPHDSSWSFDKILNINTNICVFIPMYDFSSFLADFS